MPNPVRIPDDTRSIHNIGEFIMSQQTYQNTYLNALVNRIGRVIVTSRTWRNPWAVFKKGKLEYGEQVEEIFVNIAKPMSFDPSVAESEVFKREIPDVRAAFHTMNYQKFYKVTVSNDQLRQAFLSYAEMTSLIAYIVDSLYNSMSLDEYLVMKYMVARELVNGGVYTVVTPAIDGDSADPEGAVEQYRAYTNNLTFYKSTYNRAHVRTSSPVERQVIIVPTVAESIIGVRVLAAAFNISEVEYLGRRVLVDGFDFDTDDTARLAEIFANDATYTPLTGEQITALQAVSAFKCDIDWMMCFDNFEQFTENYNGQGLYWQYFYHTWKTFSSSPFHNAVAFTSQASSVSTVTVSPATSNVVVGTSVQMTAAVKGTGLFPKTVVWSIAGTTPVKSGTNIDPSSGVLHVASDELVGNVITVTATADGGKTGTAKITVTAAGD